MFQKFDDIVDKSISFKLNKKVLYIFFALFIIIVSVTSYFHEPWYDEAQAWQIARCASIYDIIFTIPHYEGHPPLWHLLLAVFAKNGINVDFSLHFVNILAISGAVCLLMFKTKLPDILKAILPFTYFMCYQYGVISRPYSLMTLAFMFCAVFYNKKNGKPFAMVLSLLFLCLTSAYGLLYAFFICICWLIEMYKTKGINEKSGFVGFVRYFVKTRTFVSLCFLFVCAVCILLLIIPCDDAFFTYSKTESISFSSFANKFTYTFLLLPYEATIGCITQRDMDVFDGIDYLAEYTPYYIISVLIYFLLWKAMKSRGKSELMIPMLFMPLFFALIFFFAHHIGLVTLYIIFLVVIYFDSPAVSDKFMINGMLMSMCKVFSCFLYLFAIIQMSWSISSCAIDVTKTYHPGKKIAEYIKDNNLEDCYILPPGDYNFEIYTFDISDYAVTSLPYFDRNIYPTFQSGSDDEAYVHNSLSTEIEKYKIEGYDDILALGKPDYMIGRIPIKYDEDEEDSANTSVENNDGFALNYNEVKQTETSQMLNDFYDIDEYTIVEDIPYGCIFKGHYIENYLNIYKRKDTQ